MTDYWVLVAKQSEMNVAGTTPAADTWVVQLQPGSALDSKLLSNYTGSVTVNGRTGYLRAGPFTSQAGVNAYLQVGAQTANSPIPGIGISPGGGLTLDNPLSGIESFLQPITTFLHDLTSASFWERVLLVLVGVGLVVVGTAHIASGTPVGKTALKVGKAAAIL